jgi:hypothetical protein
MITAFVTLILSTKSREGIKKKDYTISNIQLSSSEERDRLAMRRIKPIMI